MSPAVLVLAAHGSADPRAAITTHAVAEQIRRDRPGLGVRVAFCERSTPNLRDVVADVRGDAIVRPCCLPTRITPGSTSRRCSRIPAACRPMCSAKTIGW